MQQLDWPLSVVIAFFSPSFSPSLSHDVQCISVHSICTVYSIYLYLVTFVWTFAVYMYILILYISWAVAMFTVLLSFLWWCQKVFPHACNLPGKIRHTHSSYLFALFLSLQPLKSFPKSQPQRQQQTTASAVANDEPSRYMWYIILYLYVLVYFICNLHNIIG